MPSPSISAGEILGIVVNVVREDGNGVVGSGGHTTVWRGIARISSERSPMIVAVKELKCFSSHNLQPNEKHRILRVMISFTLVTQVNEWTHDALLEASRGNDYLEDPPAPIYLALLGNLLLELEQCELTRSGFPMGAKRHIKRLPSIA